MDEISKYLPELVPVLTMQMVLLALTIIFGMLGGIRLTLLAIRLPKSEFKTVFSQMAVSLWLICVILIGFLFAVATRVGGATNFKSMITGIVGVIGVFILLYSFNNMMKFLTGGESS